MPLNGRPYLKCRSMGDYADGQAVDHLFVIELFKILMRWQ